MNRTKITEKIKKLQNLADGNPSPHESAAALSKAHELQNLLTGQRKKRCPAHPSRSSRGIFEKVSGSGVFWIRFVDASGRYRREKIGTFSAAEKLYHKRKQQALEGVKLPENLRQRSVLFAELADTAIRYIEQKYRRPAPDVARVRVLKLRFQGAADSFSVQQIKNTLDTMTRENNWSNSTRNHHHNLISLCFRLGIENDRGIAINPARGFRRLKGNECNRFLTYAEEASLRKVMRDNPAWASHEVDIALAISTGLRMSNMYRDLKWENVDLEARTATIPRTKNGDAIVVPLNDDAMAALEVYRARGDETGRVVRGSKGNTLNYTAFWYKPALMAAGIKNATWHTLRHTYASRLLQTGTPLSSIATLLGHRQLMMTRRYAHLSMGNLHEAVGRISSTKPEPNSTTVAPSESDNAVLSGYVQ